MSNLPDNISNGVNNVKNTFTSWDTCMSKTYCKWPVIIGIVIASIVVLSILWCVASCLCCGATLCGACVKCLTCGSCCGACSKGRDRGGGSRHKDDYTKMPPTPYNGYQPQPSPMAYQPPSNGPQFAQFDVGNKKVHADSLPAMPSWDTARTRHVEDHSPPGTGFGQDVEMGRMHAAPVQTRMRGGYNQVPNGPVSPMSPPVNYGHFEGQGHPYHSDIGVQRLGPQETGYTDFDPSPLSPAPTYTSTAAPVVAAAHHTDRFAPGTMSPSPSDYHNHSQPAPTRSQAWSPIPSPHHEQHEYQSYRRSLSPPVDHYTQTPVYQDHDQSAARPPSLLQIGRKPVVGSQREV